MVPKQLIVVVEGTAAIGPFWQTIVSDYLDTIIRFYCGNETMGQKPMSATQVELALVMFNTHGSCSGCLVQQTDWTRDMGVFLQWLSALPFSYGGFSDAAIAEGLGEALMMFSSSNERNGDAQRHCILVAASNPYPLPTPVYRLQPQNMEQSDNGETQPDNRLSDAEALAKSFAQGKSNPRAADAPTENAKNPHFLVLISENFMEARAALTRSGMLSLASNQNPVKMDITPAPPPISSPPTVSVPAGMSQQIQPGGMQPVGMNANSSVTNMPMNQQSASTIQSAQSKYIKVWEGNLSGWRQGQTVFITRLEGYRNASASEALAANLPLTMQIVRLIPQDYMNNKQYVGKADFLVFRAMDQNGFLGQLQEKKLFAIIQLPSQTLLLSVSNKAYRLIGMLFPGDTVVVKPQIPNPQQQQQQQQLQQQQHMQQLQQQQQQQQQQQI